MLFDRLKITFAETCWDLKQSGKGLSFVLHSAISFGFLSSTKCEENGAVILPSAKRNHWDVILLSFCLHYVLGKVSTTSYLPPK